MKTRQTIWLWRACVASALMLVILCFSPIVLAPGKVEPFLFGMPYALWSSILITFLLVVLTFLATRFHPGNQKTEKA